MPANLNFTTKNTENYMFARTRCRDKIRRRRKVVISRHVWWSLFACRKVYLRKDRNEIPFMENVVVKLLQPLEANLILSWEVPCHAIYQRKELLLSASSDYYWAIVLSIFSLLATQQPWGALTKTVGTWSRLSWLLGIPALAEQATLNVLMII